MNKPNPTQEQQEAIDWLENDARYLHKCVAEYEAKDDVWSQKMAAKVMANAIHSQQLADKIKIEARS